MAATYLMLKRTNDIFKGTAKKIFLLNSVLQYVKELRIFQSNIYYTLITTFPF